MKYHREPIDEVPVFLGQLKLLFTQEKGMWATITFNGAGYQISVWSGKGSTNFVLCAERTKKPRIFRTADAALKTCRELGCGSADVHL